MLPWDAKSTGSCPIQDPDVGQEPRFAAGMWAQILQTSACRRIVCHFNCRSAENDDNDDDDPLRRRF